MMYIQIPKFEPTYRRVFDSVDAVLAEVRRKNFVSLDFGGKPSSLQVDRHGTWTYGVDFPGAVKMLSNGWPEGADAINRIAQPMVATLCKKIYRPEPVYADSGDFYDVGRLLTGEPEHWVRFDSVVTDGVKPAAGGPITIAYNIGASGGLDANTINARGAAALALVSVLEASGRPVELWVMAEHNGLGVTGWKSSTQILAKRLSAPIDMGRLAFMIAHPAMNRRIRFRLSELMGPEDRRGMGDGYGQTIEDSTATDADIVFCGALWNAAGPIDTPDKARAWVQAMCEAQGIVFTEPLTK